MLVDGEPRENLRFAQSLDFTFKTEIKQEGFLGETTDRYDSVFHGVEGKTQHQFDTPEPFNVVRLVVNKARSRTPGTVFNLRATLRFPGGGKARVVFRDVAFGPMPVTVGSRSDYVKFSLDFACSEAQVLPV